MSEYIDSSEVLPEDKWDIAKPSSLVGHFMFWSPEESRQDWAELTVRCERWARLAASLYHAACQEGFIYSGGKSQVFEEFTDEFIEWGENGQFPTENRGRLLTAIAKSFPYVEESDRADIAGDELLRTAALKLQARGESLDICFNLVDNIEHLDFRNQAHQQLENNL